MKIKLPFRQVAKLVTDLVRFLPGGVSKEEGHQLVQDMLAVALPLLLQVTGEALPVEMVNLRD